MISAKNFPLLIDHNHALIYPTKIAYIIIILRVEISCVSWLQLTLNAWELTITRDTTFIKWYLPVRAI